MIWLSVSEPNDESLLQIKLTVCGTGTRPAVAQSSAPTRVCEKQGLHVHRIYGYCNLWMLCFLFEEGRFEWLLFIFLMAVARFVSGALPAC